MDDREKLVGLLFKCTPKNVKTELCGEKITITISEGNIADFLIAHGVTVQEWISVKDRLPQKQGFYRAYHKNSKAICDRFYYTDCPDLFVNVKDDPITHWKPMEQPPKGE